MDAPPGAEFTAGVAGGTGDLADGVPLMALASPGKQALELFYSFLQRFNGVGGVFYEDAIAFFSAAAHPFGKVAQATGQAVNRSLEFSRAIHHPTILGGLIHKENHHPDPIGFCGNRRRDGVIAVTVFAYLKTGRFCSSTDFRHSMQH